MSAVAGILNLVVKANPQTYINAPEGSFNMTPTIVYPSATSSSTIQVYFGGEKTSALAAATLYFERDDGQVLDNHALVFDSNGVSGTYTTTNTDTWLLSASAGHSFNVYVGATLANDTSGPNASAIIYTSAKLTISTS